MPVFTIETPTGQKLDIEAADQAAALRGAQQWHADNSPSFTKSLEQGVANVPGGIAKTIQTHLGEGPVSNTLKEAADAAAPEHYVPAPIYDEKGFHAGNIPAYLAERAPSMATAIAAARVTPGPWWAKLLGGAAAGAFMSAGNEVQQAADTRTGTPGATPTKEDLIRGDLTAGAEGVANALPINRLIPGTGKVTSTGVKGVFDAAKRLGATSVAQGASGGLADVAHQVGQTVGTPGGIDVNPTEVIDQTLGGGLTGGMFGAKNAVREGMNAIKYREITPDLQNAATQFANRMNEFADGRSLDAGVIGGGKAQKVGAEVVNKASMAVRGELRDAVKDLRSRVDLPTDAQNVIDAAMSGKQPSPREYGMLENAVQGDPQAANVLNLMRQSHVADIVRDSGTMSGEKFKGGLSSKLEAPLTPEHIGKTAIAGLAGAGGLLASGGGAHLIAYSPEMLSALAGASVLARMGDKLTGARAPAGRFVGAFGDDNTPIRANVPLPVPASAPAVARPGATGPSVPPLPTPWGPTPPGQPFDPKLFPKAAQQFSSQASLPLRALAKVANNSAVQHGLPILAGVVGGHLAGEVGGHLASSATHEGITGLAESLNARIAAQQNQEALPLLQQLAASAPPVDTSVPSKVLTQTRALVRGLQATQKLKQRQLGENQADEVASGSPLIDRVGGPDVIANPEAGKRMSQMVSAAKALQQLQQDRGVLPGRVTGAAATVTGPGSKVLGPGNFGRGFLLEKDRTPANAPNDFGIAPEPQQSVREQLGALVKPTGVSKGNGKIETNTTNGAGEEYTLPQSPYAHLSVQDAANAIAKDAERAGNVKYLAGFRSATQRNLTAIRNAAAGVAKEVPGADARAIASQFEGVRDRAAAKAHREYLKKQMPSAAGALDTYFNDEVIGRIWKRKG